MATRLVRISELDLSTTSSPTDIIEVSVVDNTQPSGYNSKKQRISTVANNIANSIIYNDLTTASKTLVGGLNTLDSHLTTVDNHLDDIDSQLDGVATLLAQI